MVSASVDSESTFSENKSFMVISLVTGCCGPFVKRNGDVSYKKNKFQQHEWCSFCLFSFISFRFQNKNKDKLICFDAQSHH